jgi:hypothetical protein
VPFSLDSVESGLHFSTLDYIGRPSLTITKKNVHKLIHNEAFQVSYDFQNQGLFIEPLYVIAFFFVCYLSAILYGRVNFNFDDDKKKN